MHSMPNRKIATPAAMSSLNGAEPELQGQADQTTGSISRPRGPGVDHSMVACLKGSEDEDMYRLAATRTAPESVAGNNGPVATGPVSGRRDQPTLS